LTGQNGGHRAQKEGREENEIKQPSGEETKEGWITRSSKNARLISTVKHFRISILHINAACLCCLLGISAAQVQVDFAELTHLRHFLISVKHFNAGHSCRLSSGLLAAPEQVGLAEYVERTKLDVLFSSRNQSEKSHVVSIDI
jgi:hypothetical protein